MYNGAGKFTKDHGVPAKSGIAGGLMVVIPGIGAVASFSPPLDKEGHSIRGIAMVDKLAGIYSNINLFHKDSSMKDLTRKAYQTIVNTTIACCNAASCGDLESVHRLYIQGCNLDASDYDKRTPLHLAAFGNHLEVVKFLIGHGAKMNPHDRWGCTPLDDAADEAVINFMKHSGCHKGKDLVK
jgi:glutaminase